MSVALGPVTLGRYGDQNAWRVRQRALRHVTAHFGVYIIHMIKYGIRSSILQKSKYLRVNDKKFQSCRMRRDAYCFLQSIVLQI